MHLKKILLGMSSLAIIGPTTSSVVSCFTKTQPKLQNYSKAEVNEIIYKILDADKLDVTTSTYGNQEIFDWYKENLSGIYTESFWLDVKVTAIFMKELLKRIPNLYSLFPQFSLLAGAKGQDRDLVDVDGTDRFAIEGIFWQGESVKYNSLRLNINLAWSFTNGNSFELLDSLIKKEVIWYKTRYGIEKTYDEVKNDREPRFTYEIGGGRFLERWHAFEYFVDNRSNSVWNTDDNFTPEPVENHKVKNFHLSITFNKINNRKQGLEAFINDLKLVTNSAYDNLRFNELFRKYFLVDYASYWTSIDPILNLKDYPQKNYFEILKNSKEELDIYQKKVNQIYKKNLSEKFFLNSKNYQNNWLVDDIEINIKPKKLFSPKEFNQETMQGIINSLFWGYEFSSDIEDPNQDKWKNYESGVLILEMTVNFIQKNNQGEIINSIPYSFDQPIFSKYI